MQSDILPLTLPLAGAQASEVLVLSSDGMFKTIQGEGPRIGRTTTFLRLGGCNLKCSWCDTPYTWDWTRYNPRLELHPTPIDHIAKDLKDSATTSLTITGGEPLAQWRNLAKLFYHLQKIGWILDKINFETNGTIWPEWDNNIWATALSWGIVISPKLANSGNSILTGPPETIVRNIENFVRWSILEEKWDGFGSRSLVNVDYKFVCQSTSDFHEIHHIRELVSATGHAITNTQIWVMPEGTDPLTIAHKAQQMVDEVIRLEWNLTPRYHQDIWGNARAK